MKSDERSPLVRVDEENLARIHELVFQFFNDDIKARVWLRTPNPMIGGVSPRDMMRMGRYDRLLSFVTQAIEEGQPSRLGTGAYGWNLTRSGLTMSGRNRSKTPGIARPNGEPQNSTPVQPTLSRGSWCVFDCTHSATEGTKGCVK
jgi:hypothetical protein